MNALILVLRSRLHFRGCDCGPCMKRRHRKGRRGEVLSGEKEARAKAHMAPRHPELLTAEISDEDIDVLAGIVVATHLRDLREEKQ